MFKTRTLIFGVLTALMLVNFAVAQSSRSGQVQGSGSRSGSATPTPVNTKRAKDIFERTKILTASVITTSKGAKGIGAPITDRNAWAEVAKVPAFNIISQAERLITEPIPEPNEDEYMQFYTEPDWKKFSEDTQIYQRKYDQRRQRFYRLVLAECIENKGRFLPSIEETILVICSEPSWTVPWDDSEARIFKGESRRIEHRTCETAWNLATADYWLGRKLSPMIRELIREKVTERVFSVFEEAILTDSYSLIPWANESGAWNAKCHAAVVGAAQALIDSPEHRANYLAAAEINVERFLKIFSKDGYFPDGVWGWNNGYGSFILLAETFYQATSGRIDLFRRPNIRETALYGPRMEITPSVFGTFGDRWAGDRPSLEPTAFISKRFQMGLTAIENRAPFFGVGPTHLYIVGIYCFPNSATLQKGEIGKPVALPLETLRDDFPPSGVTILRTGKKERDQIGVQLKGGSNDERGNHSDVGTFIVALGGGTPITDVGSRYFQRGLVVSSRMDSNTYNSFGHSVPRIDGMLQKNGKGTVAPRMESKYTDDVDMLKFDLQYVYDWAEPKDLKELTRTFIYDRTGKESSSTPRQASFTVVDRFNNRKPLSFETCLITLSPFKKLTEDPEATSIELIIGQDDQALLVTVTNEVLEKSEELNRFVRRPRPLEFEAGVLNESMPRTDNSPIRLAFTFDQPVDDATITFTIRPAPKDKRSLAKNNPDVATRIYTSPIDELAAASAGGEDAKEDRYAHIINEIQQKLPVPLETLLRLSNEELKVHINRAKRLDAGLRSLTDADVDAIIRRLRGEPDEPEEETKTEGDEGGSEGDGESQSSEDI